MKHSPQRICIACRQASDKRDLIRIVRTSDGVAIDVSGKKAGRGAYLHPAQACWRRALENRLVQRALRTGIDSEQLALLVSFADQFEGDE